MINRTEKIVCSQKMMKIARIMASNKEPEVSGRELEISSHLLLSAVSDLFCWLLGWLVGWLMLLPIASGRCSGCGC